MSRIHRSSVTRCLASAIAGLCASYGVCATPDLAIKVVSSRADAVSGDSVLLQLDAPAEASWGAWLNGRNVTTSFRPVEGSNSLRALLDGLKQGGNALEIKTATATLARLDLTDYPLTGPIFSGPHQKPFICQTMANGLGPPLDADCSAHTRVEYYYKSTAPNENEPLAAPSPNAGLAPGFKVYDPSAPPPIDVARTVTTDGTSVPYIVRREIGTINRAVYDIEFLHQPGTPLPTPWTRPTRGWNGRLVYLLDGGCGAGYRQGLPIGSVGAAGEPFISMGYATATSTLNVFGNSCNDRLGAETLSMVKEHLIKQYGPPVHTIGWGESGGAIEQYLIAQNYPGLLDGIIPHLSFPDEFSTDQSVSDCALLSRAFLASKQPWTEEQKAAVSGFASWQTCSVGWSDGGGHTWPFLDPRRNCPPSIPKELVYDRTSNPKGVRCDVYSNEINFLGRNPETGLAYRPLDNVGVQYGLAAFNRGRITVEQFVELNELIGGFDDDGGIIATRTAADPQSLGVAYERGLILTGGGGLSQTPIIDWRQYNDDTANQHDRFRSFVTRARLMEMNDSADNQVIITYPRWSAMDIVRYTQIRRWEEVFPQQAHDLVNHMDRWLDNIEADRSEDALSIKVARDKPADLSEGCWATDGEHVIEHASYDGPGRCNQLYPSYGDPRIAAGGPLTDDVLKCTLKPIDPTEYAKPLTADQLKHLEAAFSGGVCDYTRPGVGQENIKTAWQRPARSWIDAKSH